MSLYKVKLQVTKQEQEGREEFIEAASAEETKEKIMAFCQSQLIDNDTHENIVDVQLDGNDAVSKVEESDQPNNRAGTPQKF
tara:strand:+ start:1754 stop:1999 length:246 start_codon:yes stop_codon:yes gene_type:complete